MKEYGRITNAMGRDFLLLIMMEEGKNLKYIK
jgi:hypothetical protein